MTTIDDTIKKDKKDSHLDISTCLATLFAPLYAVGIIGLASGKINTIFFSDQTIQDAVVQKVGKEYIEFIGEVITIQEWQQTITIDKHDTCLRGLPSAIEGMVTVGDKIESITYRPGQGGYPCDIIEEIQLRKE